MNGFGSCLDFARKELKGAEEKEEFFLSKTDSSLAVW